MLLAVDIGNSDVTLGLYDKDQWIHIWRLPSSTNFELYYAIRIRDFFLEVDLSTSDVKDIVLSSVVPPLTGMISNVMETVFGKTPLIVGPDIYHVIPIKVLNPYQIGSDLVANAVAAYELMKRTCVVVDFGTALTFTTISGKGEILGVAIAPGIKTAIKSLSENTAKLFDVPLEVPDSVLGKNTVHAIQAGVFFGYVGMVKQILHQIRMEVGTDLATIATGGLASTIPSLSELVGDIRPTLTLDGLRHIASLAEQHEPLT
jgi:type III pantothenate kinase